ncbi:unnamed protein product [Cylicocyclus nassatus]|uniref:Uncharacterized protein n=1 Tax=Cylicocyclus nassatus TaxID=53992 RepID=A0AA36GXD9_CYLNA|nr:unnamed protein product [Cylicocyclus nassatus]
MTTVAATSFTKQQTTKQQTTSNKHLSQSGTPYKTISATGDGGYTEMYIGDDGKQVEPKERSIVSLLIVVGPLVVVKLLLLILLVLTIGKLRAIRKRHTSPEALPNAEKKEQSKDSSLATTGATTLDLWISPTAKSTTRSKESV